jgi:hypothetical protein
MRHREGQRGQARIGTIIWLLLFVAMVIVSKEMIPVKIRTAQLEDFMVDLAKFSTRETEERLQRRIMDKAVELELPLRKEDVSVKKQSGRVRMKAAYAVTLEFPFYTYVWRFNHEVDRPIFII